MMIDPCHTPEKGEKSEIRSYQKKYYRIRKRVGRRSEGMLNKTSLNRSMIMINRVKGLVVYAESLDFWPQI